MIFQACACVKQKLPLTAISGEVLQYAIEHMVHNLESAQFLDSIADRESISNNAEDPARQDPKISRRSLAKEQFFCAEAISPTSTLPTRRVLGLGRQMISFSNSSGPDSSRRCTIAREKRKRPKSTRSEDQD